MAMEVPPPEVIPELPIAAAPAHGGRLISLILLAVSVAFAVGGQFTLKSAMNDIGRIGKAELSSPGDLLLRAAKEPKLWVGLALFGISAFFWLIVLSRVALSVAYPLVGLSYIVVVAIGRFALHEQVPALRWFGVIVIALGIAMIGFSFRRATGT
jgi:multidrug transporter EmrE-like cation transporter